jgi:hypothetical protein
MLDDIECIVRCGGVAILPRQTNGRQRRRFASPAQCPLTIIRRQPLCFRVGARLGAPGKLSAVGAEDPRCRRRSWRRALPQPDSQGSRRSVARSAEATFSLLKGVAARAFPRSRGLPPAAARPEFEASCRTRVGALVLAVDAGPSRVVSFVEEPVTIVRRRIALAGAARGWPGTAAAKLASARSWVRGKTRSPLTLTSRFRVDSERPGRRIGSILRLAIRTAS